MGLKLEFVLIVMILMIVSVSMKWQLTNAATRHNALTKELEFTNTTFIEVNTQKMLGLAYSTYGVRDKGILKMDNIVYHTETIESLVAKKGEYKEDILYLNGDVVMQEKDGYTYKTQHANYNQKTEILNITTPFIAVRGQNVMKGKTLRYDTRKKEAFGSTVDAVVYTVEK